MSITRVFLGWDKPCLNLAARWLGRCYGGEVSTWDMQRLTVIVPGGRAGRRLMEVLVEQAQGRVLVPPSIVTAGRLPELLYQARVPVADPLQVLLAWVGVLRKTDPEVLGQWLTHRPDDNDWPAWIQVARDLERLDDELAGGMVGFHEVADQCRLMEGSADHDRWGVLTEIRSRFEQVLAAQGLVDRNTARSQAVQQHRCTWTDDLVLLATADLTPLARCMIHQLKTPVVALVHAQPSHADDFDDTGCFIPGRWLGQPLETDRADVRFVDRPRDQALAVVGLIGELTGIGRARDGKPGSAATGWNGPARDLRVDQITIGMGDESAGSLLACTADWAGVPVRLAVGRPIVRSRPVTLLAAVGVYLRHRRMADFAALLRHPDLEAYLVDRDGAADREADHEMNHSRTRRDVAGWLSLLDRYATDHLQGRLVGPWLGDPATYIPLKWVHGEVEGLLAGPWDEPQPLAVWSRAIADLLGRVYGVAWLDRHAEGDLELIQALETLGRVLREQADLGETGEGLTPMVTAWDAVHLTLAQLRDKQIGPEGGEPAVEVLGWLELQLDDAPVLVITGVNEGHLPGAMQGEPILSDGMRRSLGLMDSTRRLARDRMMMHTILATRPHVTLIAPRRGDEGDPLIPSRLLLTGDTIQIGNLIERFYCHEDPRQGQPTLPLGAGSKSGFPIPLPRSDKPMCRLAVTAFRDYLACPYRFYLKHVMGLRVVDDKSVEMDGGAFGRLAHEVLCGFGRSEAAASPDPNRISRYLSELLDSLLERWFGCNRGAAVVVQAEQLRRRLDAFALWQAEQVRTGWRTLTDYTESALEGTLEVDGRPMGIRGRIDRIDRHDELGYRLLDYKTADQPKKPDQVHRIGCGAEKTWVDLQLPLYRRLASGLGVEGEVSLGYVLLPRTVADAGLAPARWTAEEETDAIRTAEEVVRKVRGGVFWPPADPPRFDDGLRSVCMDLCANRAGIIASSQSLVSQADSQK